jgi:hypothetical protein
MPLSLTVSPRLTALVVLVVLVVPLSQPAAIIPNVSANIPNTNIERRLFFIFLFSFQIQKVSGLFPELKFWESLLLSVFLELLYFQGQRPRFPNVICVQETFGRTPGRDKKTRVI